MHSTLCPQPLSQDIRPTSELAKYPLTCFIRLLTPWLHLLPLRLFHNMSLPFPSLLWWCCHGDGSGEMNSPSPFTSWNDAFLFLLRTTDSSSVLHQAAMWLLFQWESSSPLFPARMLSPEFFCTETLKPQYLIAYLVKTIFRPPYHYFKRFPSSGIPPPPTAPATSIATKGKVSFLQETQFSSPPRRLSRHVHWVTKQGFGKQSTSTSLY